MSDIFMLDKASGKYRLMRKHGQPDVPVKHAPLQTMAQIETTRHCPGCAETYRACRCAGPAPVVVETPRARQLVVNRQTTGTRHKFVNESHALLACRACGHISCRCGVPKPPTFDEVLKLQQQRNP